jgi:hypothetical protein
MLTRPDYTNLWTNPAPGGFSQAIHTLPSYDEYIIRENQLQDYLDIFRGRDTRGARPIEPPVWYYDHPFLEVLKENAGAPKIEYIMIGEAAPMVASTYFYNVTHLNLSRWYDSPIAAFDCPHGRANIADKTSGLLCLAKKGYLLIDLFPFRIAYNLDLRNTLNANGVSQFFFDNHLLLIIESIINDEKNCKEKPMKMAFSGPPTIHNYLVSTMHLDGILGGAISCFCYSNNLNAAPLAHIAMHHPIGVGAPALPWLEGDFLNDHLYANPGNLTLYPFFRCCCYDGTLQNPNELFIRNAFGI